MIKELLLTFSDLTRFWDKIDKKIGDVHPELGTRCWLWTASTDGKDYGQIRVAGKLQKTHRIAYAQEHGHIPNGYVVDHLCRVHRCCRPSHLEAVTGAENTRRGIARCSKITHCPRGHEYNDTNTYRYKNERHCKPCQRTRQNVRRQALSVSRSAVPV